MGKFEIKPSRCFIGFTARDKGRWVAIENGMEMRRLARDTGPGIDGDPIASSFVSGCNARVVLSFRCLSNCFVNLFLLMPRLRGTKKLHEIGNFIQMFSVMLG